jgi:hypothetical protein
VDGDRHSNRFIGDLPGSIVPFARSRTTGARAGGDPRQCADSDRQRGSANSESGKGGLRLVFESGVGADVAAGTFGPVAATEPRLGDRCGESGAFGTLMTGAWPTARGTG